jgi:MFS family permease
MAGNQQSGLRQNWLQFTILVIVNAFVGGMVGLERSIFPRFAEQQFGISSHTALLSFIVAFGISKAIANYYTGRLANMVGRRNLLIIGWILALPVPLLLIYAPSWNWVIMANVLLGIHQGLTWSSTVVMKIDLAGEKERGLAMGLNEFAGYLAVGMVAFLSGSIADRFGVTPYPFYLGIGISIVGLILSVLFVKDTRHFVDKEEVNPETKLLKSVFIETSFTNKTLSSITQAGLVNNLNDGMVWGLLPVLLFSLQFNAYQTGMIAGIYPTVWGLAQLVTGRLSDLYAKKKLLFWGMLVQGIGIVLFPFAKQFTLLMLLSVVLGLGTALVYPTFLSAIAGATQPGQRAESIGIFRFWRDAGYAIGAIVSGLAADLWV